MNTVSCIPRPQTSKELKMELITLGNKLVYVLNIQQTPGRKILEIITLSHKNVEHLGVWDSVWRTRLLLNNHDGRSIKYGRS